MVRLQVTQLFLLFVIGVIRPRNIELRKVLMFCVEAASLALVCYVPCGEQGYEISRSHFVVVLFLWLGFNF